MQLVFERLFEKQGSTFKVTLTLTLLKWVIKRQAPNTAVCWYEIEDLHAAGMKPKKKKKKMEQVFVKHYAPNVCLPLREGHNLEETL